MVPKDMDPTGDRFSQSSDSGIWTFRFYIRCVGEILQHFRSLQRSASGERYTGRPWLPQHDEDTRVMRVCQG